MKFLTETNRRTLSVGVLFLRIMTGLILFVAGAGKVMGWFGGFGMTTTLQQFEAGMHLSAFWTYVSCYAEFIGGFLLMIGLLTRVAAFTLVINMLVATLFVGFKNFFMGGAAYPCFIGVCCLVIIFSGPMIYSIDYMLASRKKNQTTHKQNLSHAL